MTSQLENTKVLITVMTYPHPSKGYQELVCTAGITEAGEWVRLYPIDYRYRPRSQQFRKYQWIEVELEASGHGNDNRKESRRPNLDSIRILGERLPTDNDWAARREIIDRMPHHTVKQLESMHALDHTSLGVVRPTKVLDMTIEPVAREWKAEWQAELAQLRLFGPQPKSLQKLPYKFQYVFECEDSDKPHRTMCEDWELGVLFLNECERLGSEEQAAESVRNKFLRELCRDDKDTRFFMGTRFPYNTWLVLGVFWPPSTAQTLLF